MISYIFGRIFTHLMYYHERASYRCDKTANWFYVRGWKKKKEKYTTYQALARAKMLVHDAMNKQTDTSNPYARGIYNGLFLAESYIDKIAEENKGERREECVRSAKS